MPVIDTSALTYHPGTMSPRGAAKARAEIDRWLQEVAPPTELRQWFAHDLGKWAESFRKIPR